MMNEKNNSSACGRADDLVSVLYGEAGEREQRDFEVHLKQCAGCQAEFAAFAQVRESIGEWRDEALSGFVSSPAVVPQRKSATAALRQFLGLSPLWMKAAVGFAVVVFCLLLALAVSRLQTNGEVPQVATSSSHPDAVYTKDEVARMVQEALAKQERERPAVAPKPIVVESPQRKDSTVAKSHVPPLRRPFSRAERDQLAADLRLLSDENDLELIDKD